jgi:hypothetical protein
VTALDTAGARDYAREIEAQYYHRAIAFLDQILPDTTGDVSLRQFVDTLFQRMR